MAGVVGLSGLSVSWVASGLSYGEVVASGFGLSGIGVLGVGCNGVVGLTVKFTVRYVKRM